MILYHGGTDVIEKPEIKKRSGGRDFGIGFYCTEDSLAYLKYCEIVKAG